MPTGPTNRPKLVAEPYVRVTDEEATLQLVAGLRFTIRADSVKREWDEARVPADVVAAQEAGPMWAFQGRPTKRPGL